MTFVIREVDPGLVARLTAGLRVHPVTARCLVGRGHVDTAGAKAWLDPRLGGLRKPEGLAG
ncbi:MAG: hypothetical protein K8W52_08930, partial [Deltaproteobacteria bacterium]|nr:hypothetical protein [Deltaproteobacteria bacterium]